MYFFVLCGLFIHPINLTWILPVEGAWKTTHIKAIHTHTQARARTKHEFKNLVERNRDNIYKKKKNFTQHLQVGKLRQEQNLIKI